MVAGYHLIWTAYGFWLPNDPRGSTSSTIQSIAIARLGELHYGRKRIQPAGKVIRQFYEAAGPILKHELRTISNAETSAIADAFGNVIRDRNYTCYACAIMPDHVHLLIRKHRDQAVDMIENLQSASRTAVIELGERASDHPVWCVSGWKVYLDTRDEIERTIHYIEENPGKARMPIQSWAFVSVYDGWLPGQVRVVKIRKG